MPAKSFSKLETAEEDAWDEEVYARTIPEIIFDGEVTNTIIMSEAEIAKFIKMYGGENKDFSLSLIEPNSDKWGSDGDAYDDGNGIDLRDVLSGESSFSTNGNPPILVYMKMAAAGLTFKVHWDSSDNMREIGIGDGEAKNGKFWHCLDFYATEEELQEYCEKIQLWEYRNYINHIDKYGNRCELDTTRVVVHGTKRSKENIYALPVKKMLETGEGWDEVGEIYKVPGFYASHYEEEELETDEFSEFLRAPAGGSYGENGGYLLDKDGKRITSVKDFDHSEPDEDGNIYYPVPESDLVDDANCEMLTPEACEKWRAKLGL